MVLLSKEGQSGYWVHVNRRRGEIAMSSNQAKNRIAHVVCGGLGDIKFKSDIQLMLSKLP